jgi:catechol 2,3-dioxygenase-like lactoylglutathione lyase family enzyme
MPKLTKIKETCLYVSDLERTREFYCDVMGLELIALKKGRHVFFRVGDDVLLCFLAEATRREKVLTPHYAEGKQHYALECPAEDYEAWKEHLAAHGIGIEREIEWSPGCRSIYFRDPDEHSVEIAMPGLWD